MCVQAILDLFELNSYVNSFTHFSGATDGEQKYLVLRSLRRNKIEWAAQEDLMKNLFKNIPIGCNVFSIKVIKVQI